MKIQYVELSHKLTGEILNVQGITDYYCNVMMTYNQKNDLKFDDLPKIYQDEYYRDILDSVKNSKVFNIEAEAKDLPSIGNYIVTIKDIEVGDAI